MLSSQSVSFFIGTNSHLNILYSGYGFYYFLIGLVENAAPWKKLNNKCSVTDASITACRRGESLSTDDFRLRVVVEGVLRDDPDRTVEITLACTSDRAKLEKRKTREYAKGAKVDCYRSPIRPDVYALDVSPKSGVNVLDAIICVVSGVVCLIVSVFLVVYIALLAWNASKWCLRTRVDVRASGPWSRVSAETPVSASPQLPDTVKEGGMDRRA